MGENGLKDSEKAILRLLKESGLELTPSNIAKNTGYSAGYIRQECKRLEAEGLLQTENEAGHPFYAITDKGGKRLEGSE